MLARKTCPTHFAKHISDTRGILKKFVMETV